MPDINLSGLNSSYLSGTTAQRPSSTNIGALYFNTDIGCLQIYTSIGWFVYQNPANPLAPTSVVATNQGTGRAFNNGQMSIAFTPTSTGGTVTSFTATSSPGGYSATGSSSPITVTGLQSSAQYTFTVTASNLSATSSASSASSAVTATTVPQAPTLSYSTAGSGTVTLTWTAGATGGSAITGYTITPYISNVAQATTSATSAETSKVVSGLTNGTMYTFTIRATNANGNSLESNSVSGQPTSFTTNQSTTDLYTTMVNVGTTGVSTPTAGGTLAINGVSLGSFDYVRKSGNQTVSSFVNSDWFTTTEDSRSALIYVNGNLTINSGQVFKPANRKLFTCIFVNGNLTVNGEISMTGRGANHSSSGSNIAAGNILIKSGTYSGISNPQIPAAGGSGGSGGVDPDGSWGGSGTGGTGGAGTNGGTGGGAGGRHYLPTSPNSIGSGGTGAAGTSFSGGSAGGSPVSGYFNAMNVNAQANGGYGGDSYNYYAGSGQKGGAGNPTGKSYYGSVTPIPNSTTSEVTGTGGVLIIFVTGTYSGSGSVTSQGMAWSDGGASASGSGSVTILAGVDSGPTPNASGVAGGDGTGGAGTARKLILV
jgi:Fibronectin type III domain